MWLAEFMGWNAEIYVIHESRADALLLLIFLQFLHLWFLGWWRHCFPVLQRNLLGWTDTGCICPRISAIGVMGRWWHIWWGFPGSGLALPRSQLKALEVCGCAKFAHILPNALCHAGGKHLTLQRENLLSRCPGCWYRRFVRHILLDPRDDIASLLCREKERAEALKGKEDKLHTYSGLSWTSAIGIILWKRVIHPLLSILPLQIFSMEKMSNIRIWHLDQWQQHKLHALVTSVSMEPQNKLWHVLAFTGPRFKPSY